MIDALERARLLEGLGIVPWRLRGAAPSPRSAVDATRLAVVRAGRWLVVAQASADDATLPFGNAGTALFDRLIASVGLARGATRLVSGPAGMANEADAAVVLLLGAGATRALLGSDDDASRLRGRRHEVRVGDSACAAVVSHHPSHLLRHLGDKAEAWADLLLAQDCAGA